MTDPLFSTYDLSKVLNSKLLAAQEEIDGCAEDYLLGVSENDFVEHLVSKYSTEPPQLGEAFMLEPREVDVDVSRDPHRPLRPGHTHVKGCRVEIQVPFTGDSTFFRCQPSIELTSYPLAEISQEYLSLG